MLIDTSMSYQRKRVRQQILFIIVVKETTFVVWVGNNSDVRCGKINQQHHFCGVSGEASDVATG